MTAGPPLVIALHCSGSIGQQWGGLAERLGHDCAVHAPDLLGAASRGHWSGDGPFSLAAEAAPILELIDRWAVPVHLVGHSYGGGLALHVARARPAHIASLALYEPSAFNLLKAMGREGAAGLEEIGELMRAIDDGVLTGAHRKAAARFVDYWNGAGAWAAMPPRLKAALIGYLPKACLDFRALIGEPGSPAELRRLGCPVLLLAGEHALRPSRLVVDALTDAIPNAARRTIPGAGHMGPVTHTDLVASVIADFIRRSGTGLATASQQTPTAALAA